MVHHIDHRLPHYHAVEATAAVRRLRAAALARAAAAAMAMPRVRGFASGVRAAPDPGASRLIRGVGRPSSSSTQWACDTAATAARGDAVLPGTCSDGRDAAMLTRRARSRVAY